MDPDAPRDSQRDPSDRTDPTVKARASIFTSDAFLSAWDDAQGGMPFVLPGEVYLGSVPERYPPERELGRGGMGVVYLCRDRALGREVAQKTNLFRDGRDAALRFLREAEILAQLHHPGIVPIYDFGVDPVRGPFFVMRFIDGETLQDLVASRKRQPAAWLEVFLKICDTVAYAHEHGIVHRDLKPTNIMIGPHGEVLVLDWGLAGFRSGSANGATAARSDGLTTRAGARLGTPRYMAPEQREGDSTRIDAVTDVYLLGGVLGFILDGKAPRERGKEPFDSDVSPELAAIATKALAEDRSQRYASVVELAQDVRRFRARREVAAFRYTPVRRLRLAAARRPGAAAAVLVGVAVLLAVLSLVGVSSWALREESARARSQRDIGLSTVDHIVLDLEDRLVGRSGTLELRRELLDTARRGLRDLEPGAEDRGRLARYVALIQARLASVASYGGDTAGVVLAADALAAIDRAIARDPEDRQLQLTRFEALLTAGRVYWNGGNPRAAHDVHAQALRVAEELADPDDPASASRLALARAREGHLLFLEGFRFEAVEQLTASLELYRRILESDPGDRSVALSAGNLLHKLALLHWAARDTEGYAEARDEGLRIAGRLLENGQRDPDAQLLELLFQLLAADHASKSDDLGRASALVRDVRRTLDELVRRNPGRIDLVYQTAEALALEGDVYLLADEPELARGSYALASALVEGLTAREPNHTYLFALGYYRANQAHALVLCGARDEAARAVEDAFEIYARLQLVRPYSETAGRLLACHLVAAEIALQSVPQDLAGAEEHLLEAERYATQSLKASDEFAVVRGYMEAQAALGRIRINSNRLVAAESAFVRLLRACERYRVNSEVAFGELELKAHLGLCAVYRDEARDQELKASWRTAMDLSRALCERFPDNQALETLRARAAIAAERPLGQKEVWANRGTAYYHADQLEDAVRAFSEALAIDPGFAYAYFLRGEVFKLQGNHVAAITDLTNAVELDPDEGEAWLKRGLCLQAYGDDRTALADFARSRELLPDRIGGIALVELYSLLALWRDDEAVDRAREVLRVSRAIDDLVLVGATVPLLEAPSGFLERALEEAYGRADPMQRGLLALQLGHGERPSLETLSAHDQPLRAWMCGAAWFLRHDEPAPARQLAERVRRNGRAESDEVKWAVAVLRRWERDDER